MGKKAVIGTSPADLSVDKMDRFIQREERKEQENVRRYGKKDLSKTPFNEWPIDKKINFYENRSDADKFKEKYPNYRSWYDAVKKQSGVYHTTFVDWTAKLRDVMHNMYANHTSVKETVRILKQKHGIY